MERYSETIPIQYEERKATFMGMEVLVDPRVLIPRPETELLVSVSAELCREKKWIRPFILDLGTGSGIVSIGLAKMLKDCFIIATDVSRQALDVAYENIMRFNYQDRINLVASDMFLAFHQAYKGKFNCIISNPPYVSEESYEKLDLWVKAEPRCALYAGAFGMDYLNIIAEKARRFLSHDGFVAVEIGYDQARKVKSKFRRCGFKNITPFKDFNGYERVIVGDNV